MSRTYRSRHKHTHAASKVEYMKDTWFNRWTGIPEPLHDDGSWDKYSRDGIYSSGRCKGYREDTNQLIRVRNRVDATRIKNDPEYAENMSFADKHDAKKFIWRWW